MKKRWFADALILLGMRYDSDAALGFASGISRFIQEQAHEASSRLAEERGSFPNWAGNVWDTNQQVPMRNATVTTIAPRVKRHIHGSTLSSSATKRSPEIFPLTSARLAVLHKPSGAWASP